MPNINTILKSEISRLSLRSTRPLYSSLKKDVAWLKRQSAEQRRLLARLSRENARLVADLNTRLAAPPTVPEAELRHARLSPHMIRAQRRRLGLSRQAFGKLARVSAGSVFAWEGGRSKPRSAAKAALISIRALGKREARQRLEVLAGANGAKRTQPRRTRRGRRRSGK